MTNSINKKKISKLDISTGLFYAGIICELLVSFTGYLLGNYHESLIIVLGMVMFSFSILFDMDLKKDWPIYLVCGAYGLASYYFQNSAFVLRICLALLAGRRQDAKQVVRIFFWGTLAGMLFFGFLSAIGMHNSLYEVAQYRAEMERRYTFGFIHPNGFSLFTFRVLIMGLYGYKDKINGMIYTTVFVVSMALMYLSGSKTGLAMNILALGLFGLDKFLPKLNLVIEKICIALATCVPLYMIYVRFQDNISWSTKTNEIWMLVDRITTGRSGNAYEVFKKYTPTLMGLRERLLTAETGYVSSLYNQGIIFMIVFTVMAVWILVHMIKQKNTAAVITITMALLFSISESYLEYYNKNMVWMLMTGVLFAKEKLQDAKS